MNQRTPTQTHIHDMKKAIETTIARLSNASPKQHVGPIEIALAQYWPQIRELIRQGWASNKVAESLVAEGLPFAQSSIRLRISKMRRSHRTVVESSRAANPAPPRAERHVIFARPPTQPAEPTSQPSALRVPPAQRARPAQRNS